VTLDVRFVSGDVGLGARAAIFLVGEQDHADGAAGFDVEVFDELRHAHHDGDSRAVIDGAHAGIP
jgi:hypothetical protein